MRMKRGLICAALFCILLAAVLKRPAFAAAEPVHLQLKVENELTGDIPSSTEPFTFVLEGADDAPMPEDSIITIYGAGTGVFPVIAYTVPETYKYTLRQIAGNTKGYTYDDTVYDVTVQVTEGNTGILELSLWVCAQGHDFKTDRILFANYFSSPDVEDSQNPLAPEDPSSSDKIPQTGDKSNVVFWKLFNIISFFALIVVFRQIVKTRMSEKRQ